MGGRGAGTNGTPGVKAEAVERSAGGAGAGAGGGVAASDKKLDGGEAGVAIAPGEVA